MNVAVLCTLETGLQALKIALAKGVVVQRIVGLHPDSVRDADAISGYLDITAFAAERDIEFRLVHDYSLKSEHPEVLGKEVDLLWVCGWQRLVPQRFLDAVNLATVGAHGSCDGIVQGRGRSPQNWALLMGKDSFEISLFTIDAGVDSGGVIASERFQYSVQDDISHSYLKVGYAIGEAMWRVYQSPEMIGRATPQQGAPAYFPKRTPDDGYIDWHMSSVDIYNQIRALTLPYPCCRSTLGGQEIRIVSAIPFQSSLRGQPGEILDVTVDGRLLVAASDGNVLLQDTDVTRGDGSVFKRGGVLDSASMQRTVDRILERFGREFPGKALNPSLQAFWKSRGLLR